MIVRNKVWLECVNFGDWKGYLGYVNGEMY